MAETNGREWLRVLAPYLVALAGFVAAGISMAAAARVAPVEQRVAALEARDDATRVALQDMQTDIREIRNHLYRWDDDRRRGRFFSPDPPNEQEGYK